MSSNPFQLGRHYLSYARKFLQITEKGGMLSNQCKVIPAQLSHTPQESIVLSDTAG